MSLVKNYLIKILDDMPQYVKEEKLYSHVVLILVLLNAVIFKLAVLKDKQWYWVLAFALPLLLVAVYKNRKQQL